MAGPLDSRKRGIGKDDLRKTGLGEVDPEALTPFDIKIIKPKLLRLKAINPKNEGGHK